MKCAWQAYLNLIPQWIRPYLDAQVVLETRLRLQEPPEVVTSAGSRWLPGTVSRQDLNYVLNAVTQYSPWASESIAEGYLTGPGGHRIGICGQTICKNKITAGITDCSSLCIRAARDFPGIAEKLANTDGSILILGRPGSGKTTLLRDLIRVKSNHTIGSIAVVDEKGELWPQYNGKSCFSKGRHTDVITGCSKVHGIEMVLRNMGPAAIAVDEITAEADCRALLYAGWCGTDLMATAHAASAEDLVRRPIYRPIAESGLFTTCVTMQKDKTWKVERM